MTTTANRFCVASYNIHRCIGQDRRQDPARVAAVIAEMSPDIVGLQEVESGFGACEDARQLEYLARQTGYHCVAGVTMERPDSHYGNGLLTRRSIQTVRRHDLSVPGREPRGVLDVTLDHAGPGLRVLITHLGLTWRERQRQASVITSLTEAERERPVLVLADFNEWLPWGFALHKMNRFFGKTPSVRTFPSGWPLFRLDRAWVRPRKALHAVWAHDSRLAREASDHLPLVAQLEFASNDVVLAEYPADVAVNS